MAGGDGGALRLVNKRCSILRRLVFGEPGKRGREGLQKVGCVLGAEAAEDGGNVFLGEDKHRFCSNGN